MSEENDPVADPETSPTPPTPIESAEDRIAAKMRELDSRASESSLMAKLVADPDFRAVMEAKQRGLKVVVTSGETTTTPKVEEPEDLDSLPPSKLVKYLMSKIGEEVDSRLGSKLQPMEQRLAGLNSSIQATELDKAKAQVANAKTKFKDFDTFREDMIEINSRTGGSLTPTELYLIAKQRKVGDVPSPERVSTERPTPSSGRPTVRERKGGAKLTMEQALDASLKDLKIDFNDEDRD